MTETYVAREALRRQLALGRHAVLRAHGQAARAARDDDRDPVQACAAPAVRGDVRRRAAPERAARARAAGRRRLARDRREGAGQGMTIRTVHMDFLYGGTFRTGMPEAYERLILDTMLGDGTLFTRADEVEEQWLLVDTIVAALAARPAGFPNYAAGTWGPPSADDLHPPRRPLLEAPLSTPLDLEHWNGEDVRLADVEAALAKLRAGSRRRRRRPSLRTSVMTHLAWVPEGWEDAGARGARRDGRAASVAHDPPLPGARLGRRPDRRRRLGRALRDARHRPRRLLRGRRAAAARQAREGAGEHRRAAAHLRPAGVPALARRAGRGSRRSSSSSCGSPTA